MTRLEENQKMLEDVQKRHLCNELSLFLIDISRSLAIIADAFMPMKMEFAERKQDD